MLYWSRGKTHIVLTDEEVNVLLGETSNDAVERVQYRTSQRIRAGLERRMFRYLEKNLREDPEAFRRRFVFRSCYGDEAVAVFPMLLDAYGRVTKRATIGQYGKLAPFDDLPDQVAYAGSGRVCRVTLLEPRWLTRRLVPCGYISLPAASIVRLAGAVDNFFVATSSVVIKFHRDYVRIAVLDRERTTGA